MGGGRNASRPRHKAHHAAGARKRRGTRLTSLAAPALSGSTKRPIRLRKIMPRAGMIYPCQFRLVGRDRRDFALISAMRTDTHFLSTASLDERFAAMFEAATVLLQRQDVNGLRGSDPIVFLKALRDHDALRPWAKALDPAMFITVFLVLRAARLKWHSTPREPFDVQKHCKLARAIDGFMVADALGALGWSGVAMMEWFIRVSGKFGGEVAATRVAEEEEEDDNDDGNEDEEDEEEEEEEEEEGKYGEGGDNEDSEYPRDINMVDRSAGERSRPVTQNSPDHRIRCEEMDTEGDTSTGITNKDSTAEFREAVDQLVSRMRPLALDFDETALAETLAKLRIENQKHGRSAPRPRRPTEEQDVESQRRGPNSQRD